MVTVEPGAGSRNQGQDYFLLLPTAPANCSCQLVLLLLFDFTQVQQPDVAFG